jgi:hypothetical protein
MLGFMALLIFYGERLNGSSCIVFNDNMAVVYSLVNGASKATDLGSIVNNS